MRKTMYPDILALAKDLYIQTNYHGAPVHSISAIRRELIRVGRQKYGKHFHISAGTMSMVIYKCGLPSRKTLPHMYSTKESLKQKELVENLKNNKLIMWDA